MVRRPYWWFRSMESLRSFSFSAFIQLFGWLGLLTVWKRWTRKTCFFRQVLHHRLWLNSMQFLIWFGSMDSRFLRNHRVWRQQRWPQQTNFAIIMELWRHGGYRLYHDITLVWIRIHFSLYHRWLLWLALMSENVFFGQTAGFNSQLYPKAFTITARFGRDVIVIILLLYSFIWIELYQFSFADSCLLTHRSV